MHHIKRFTSRFGRYELISFVTGFVLLSFELIASRLLAPTVGTSTYVWTSVIGIIIAALALGFAVGGHLADKRADQADLPLILLLAAVAIGGTLFFNSSILSGLAASVGDARARGIIASIILFLPTSFIIGVSSPYLARLRNRSVDTTGRSVALLDASNSIGGIVGTFMTGFFLVGTIGLRWSLLCLVILLLIISWSMVPNKRLTPRVWLTIAALTLSLSPQAILDRSVRAEIDTPTAHYQIKAIKYGGRPVTAISTGPGGLQSGVYRDGSNELAFSYTRTIARTIELAPAKKNILIIGGGAFTLPEYLAKQYPDSQVDTVEIDPELPGIAAQYFNFNQPGNLAIISQDARTYVAQTAARYDIVVMDAYNDGSIPFSLVTAEFISDLNATTKPDGVVIANFIASTSPQCKELFATFDTVYESRFEYGDYAPLADLSYESRQNIIGTYSHRPLSWLQSDIRQPDLPKVALPTDDKAPIERLTERCSNR